MLGSVHQDVAYFESHLFSSPRASTLVPLVELSVVGNIRVSGIWRWTLFLVGNIRVNGIWRWTLFLENDHLNGSWFDKFFPFIFRKYTTDMSEIGLP